MVLGLAWGGGCPRQLAALIWKISACHASALNVRANLGAVVIHAISLPLISAYQCTALICRANCPN